MLLFECFSIFNYLFILQNTNFTNRTSQRNQNIFVCFSINYVFYNKFNVKYHFWEYIFHFIKLQFQFTLSPCSFIESFMRCLTRDFSFSVSMSALLMIGITLTFSWILSINSTSIGLRLKFILHDWCGVHKTNLKYLWQWPGIKYKQQCTRLSTMFFLTTPLSSAKYARNCSSTYSQHVRIHSSLLRDEPKPVTNQ